MTHHKSTTIELSINPDYVPDWGTWEAVRELLQNAADADDLGHPMSVTYTKGGTVKIANHGADLSRDTLLLGTTTKRDVAEQRGQFGEGYKLALAVLTRQGCQVVAHTPTETWTPVIEHSNAFAADVVKVRIKPAAKRRAGVTFLVKGISAADWARYRQRCLFMVDAGTTIDMGYTGRILLDPQFKGLLYARGIYVGVLPDDYAFGYDINSIDLDRDRKMARPWSLRYEVNRLLRNALETGTLDIDTVTRLLSDSTGEALALKDNPGWASDPFNIAVAEWFLAEHGNNAVPVTSLEVQRDLQHYGLRGVPVTAAMAAIIERVIGDIQTNKLKAGLQPKCTYSLADLTATERVTWCRETALLRQHIPDDFVIDIVDFVSGNINGTYEDKRVRIARHRLGDPVEFRGTLVHELAHKYGVDGAAEHVQAIQRIFGQVVQDLLERQQ